MVNNRVYFSLSIFLLLLFFTSCEKEIFSFSGSVEVEQHAPEPMTGFFKLSASVKNMNHWDKDKCVAGFVVEKIEQGNADSYLELDMEHVYYVYHYRDDASSDATYLWVEDVNSDISFEIDFSPSNNMYVCKAFILNFLKEEAKDYSSFYSSGSELQNAVQLIESEPCFFSGSDAIDVKLQLTNALTNEFVVKTNFEEDSRDGTKGICWSATNEMPTIDDYIYEVYSYGSDTLRLGLGNVEEDVIYLRAFNKQEIDASSTKVVYSDVLKYDRTEHIVEINTKDDLDNLFMSSCFSYGYRGTILFNYAPIEDDWSGIEVYFEPIDCSLISNADTRGHIRTNRIGEHGYIKGFSLSSSSWSDIENGGTLDDVEIDEVFVNKGRVKNSANLVMSKNEGELIDCVNIIVDQNYGLIQNCTNTVASYKNWMYHYDYWYGNNVMVNENKSSGVIINCTGDMSYVCRTNEGYMENCYP